VGHTPHPRGTAQVGDRGGAIDGGQISRLATEATFATLANVFGQSYGADGLDDFFTVPTATFRVLFVFVVLSHARRRVVHFRVTEHPTQEWTKQQLREAFPWDQAPRYLLRDQDAIYGSEFAAMTKGMGVEEVVTAPRAPWRNPFVERLVCSIRRECLDHIIVWNERSLRRTLQSHLAYCEQSRTHLSLGKHAPISRPIQPPALGRVVEIPQVGGLHHLYTRKAA
jgi:putative transposase